MMEVSWKQYAGNNVLGNLGGCQWLFEGKNYVTRLRYHTTVSGQWPLAISSGNGLWHSLRHFGSADLSRAQAKLEL